MCVSAVLRPMLNLCKMHRQIYFAAVLFVTSAVLLEAKGIFNRGNEDQFTLPTPLRNQHRTRCSPAEFLCNTSRGCIPADWICDGDDDCGDMSDEPGPEKCPSFECSSDTFKCSTKKRCVYNSRVCDGYDDCGDNSDESTNYCESRECPDDYVKCTTGQCIPQENFCKGWDRCTDGQKPISTNDCPPFHCDDEQFKCEHNSHCIPKFWICDGYNDCPDNSDEENCFNRTCTVDEVRCSSGLCMRQQAYCSSGYRSVICEVEKNDLPEPCVNFTCPAGYSKCQSDGKCFSEWERCDGYNNCKDGSDELLCSEKNCSSNEEKCPGTVRCQPIEYFCDRETDCRDGSDEDVEMCQNRKCQSTQVQCANGQCIDKEHFCKDRIWQCIDDSRSVDVDICRDFISSECSFGYSHCPGGSLCIRKEFLCDSDNDCGDWSDEDTQLCGSQSCTDTELRCDNGQCLDRERFCAGNGFCRDGSQSKDGPICDEFRNRSANRFSTGLTYISAKFVAGRKCYTAINSMCGMPHPLFAQFERFGSEARLFLKMKTMEMQQICSIMQSWRDCIQSELNQNVQCQRYLQQDRDAAKFRMLGLNVLDLACDEHFDVIGRNKACLLKFNSRGYVQISQILLTRCMEFIDRASRPEGFCDAVNLLNGNYMRCATDVIREQCDDEELVSVINKLFEYSRNDICQQSTPSTNADKDTTNAEEIELLKKLLESIF